MAQINIEHAGRVTVALQNYPAAMMSFWAIVRYQLQAKREACRADLPRIFQCYSHTTTQEIEDILIRSGLVNIDERGVVHIVDMHQYFHAGMTNSESARLAS